MLRKLCFLLAAVGGKQICVHTFSSFLKAHTSWLIVHVIHIQGPQSPTSLTLLPSPSPVSNHSHEGFFDFKGACEQTGSIRITEAFFYCKLFTLNHIYKVPSAM